MTKILTLENLSISAGEKTILHRASLALEDCRLSAIMGPMGGGKSTLIKFLAGQTDDETYRVAHEKALYRGQLLEGKNRPTVIFQKHRNQIDAASPAARLNEIELALDGTEGLFCVDEPTHGLEKKFAAKIMHRLRQAADRRAILMVSHNIEQVRKFSDHVALIAGGRVVAARPTREFFEPGVDDHATHFLKTGGLDIPYENTPTQFLAPEQRITPDGFDQNAANFSAGKENWVIKDRLSLMALPVDPRGNLAPDALGRLSPARFVFHFNLQDLTIYSPSGAVENCFEWHSESEFPDRNPPLSATICRYIDALLHAGQRITLNTGFNQNAGAAILGALLIFNGFSPASALELTAKKFPALHLGMRLEQFLWDIDLEFGA